MEGAGVSVGPSRRGAGVAPGADPPLSWLWEGPLPPPSRLRLVTSDMRDEALLRSIWLGRIPLTRGQDSYGESVVGPVGRYDCTELLRRDGLGVTTPPSGTWTVRDMPGNGTPPWPMAGGVIPAQKPLCGWVVGIPFGNEAWPKLVPNGVSKDTSPLWLALDEPPE